MKNERAAWLFFWLLLAINAVSIFGYATFTLHPELLAQSPWAARVFGFTYAVFARAQILIAFLSIVFMLVARTGLAWVPSLVAVLALSLASEVIGVGYGVPFGRYEYTELLGPKVAGVPYLIPISWFFMAVVCYRLALHLSRHRPSRVFRCLAAALLLSAWDLTLDPAMSHLSPFWVWAEKGVYYGSPLLNLFGWFVTGVVLMASFEVLRSRRWVEKLTPEYATAFYAANLMLPLGLVICSKLWGAVAVSAGAYALIGAWVMARAKWIPPVAVAPNPGT